MGIQPIVRCATRVALSRTTTSTIMAGLPKLLRFGFEITALVVYRIPQWLVSGTRILLYEDRKGNWTLRRHFRVQMLRYMVGIGSK